MERISIIICASIVPFLSFSCKKDAGNPTEPVTPIDEQLNWQRQNLLPFFTTTLQSVNFVDVNVGTAVGYNGAIICTTDGGTSWTLQSGGPNALADVSFVDVKTGTAVGEISTILRTTNGGANWMSQTCGTTDWLYGISCTDENRGTAVGFAGAIVRTTNGGAT